MEGPARSRLVALVVLLAVSVPLGVVALAGSDGGEEEDAGLRVERSAGSPELIVYVEPGLNTPERTGGSRTVTVECVDPEGRVLARQDEAWPFTDTDQNTLDPHVHMAVTAARINEVERCRLKATEPPLEGPVS